MSACQVTNCPTISNGFVQYQACAPSKSLTGIYTCVSDPIPLTAKNCFIFYNHLWPRSTTVWTGDSWCRDFRGVFPRARGAIAAALEDEDEARAVILSAVEDVILIKKRGVDAVADPSAPPQVAAPTASVAVVVSVDSAGVAKKSPSKASTLLVMALLVLPMVLGTV